MQRPPYVYSLNSSKSQTLLEMLRQLGRTLSSAIGGRSLAASASFRSPLSFFGSASHDDEHDEEHGPATTPTVFDKTIELNVVDLQGRRHTVKALVGKTLVDALVEAGFPEVRRTCVCEESCMARHHHLSYHSFFSSTDIFLPQHGILHSAQR